MSLVPFTTQIPTALKGELGSQTSSVKFVLVYTERITTRQSSLMQDCQEFIHQYICILPRHEQDLGSLPQGLRYFVIPYPKDELIKKIRDRFKSSIIYLPRAIIEARSHFNVNLPARSLVVSLIMHNCRIFPVRNCDLPSIKTRINEMCGDIAPNFSEGNPNVLLTDRGDNSYCSKAFKRKIPIVSRDWIDENYNLAYEDDKVFFFRDALESVKEHQIKPFYGLYFKLNIKNSGPLVKKLITENQGHIIYGNENSLTHIVESEGDYSDRPLEKRDEPKIVDIEFLTLCARNGYYLTRKEYNEYLAITRVAVKQENVSPPSSPVEALVEENSTPPTTNGCSRMNGNQTMLPPPSVPRMARQQSDSMNDMILKALSTFETPQTQLASTQVRRLPDPELRIEQSFEPSQHLYWSDSVSRRN